MNLKKYSISLVCMLLIPSFNYAMQKTANQQSQEQKSEDGEQRDKEKTECTTQKEAAEAATPSSSSSNNQNQRTEEQKSEEKDWKKKYASRGSLPGWAQKVREAERKLSQEEPQFLDKEQVEKEVREMSERARAIFAQSRQPDATREQRRRAAILLASLVLPGAAIALERDPKFRQAFIQSLRERAVNQDNKSEVGAGLPDSHSQAIVAGEQTVNDGGSAAAASSSASAAREL